MRIENERFSVVCLRCRQNLKLGDFTSSLCRAPKKNELKSVLHVQHVFLFTTVSSGQIGLKLLN